MIYSGAGIDIQVRDFHGGLQLNGIVDSTHSIEGSGGSLIIDSSCTGGDIHVRGDWFEIIDNCTGACVVHDQRDPGLTTKQSTQLEELWQKEGFDIDNPATVIDDTSWSFGTVTIDISGTGTTRTLTRQP